jgi:predicted kinase
MTLSPVSAQILAEPSLPSARWSKPLLIGIFGVPGAGKSEVARYLAQNHPFLLLSTDALRLRYRFESGVVTRQIMDQLATQLLPQHISIIFDGIHLGRKDRDAVRQLAQAHQAEVKLIHVVAEPSVVEQRLTSRMQHPELVAAEGKFVISPDHFRRIVRYLEAPTIDESVITVDTSYNPLAGQLKELDVQLVGYLTGQSTDQSSPI